ncbi:MAG: hypothetical protein A2X59_03470 [Nitrospirae bacterium GWC2_42_7]|nr:MAG: hypothetical protein A2X59_03470 [Nitrospirae bacterium GWC2_42_7]
MKKTIIVLIAVMFSVFLSAISEGAVLTPTPSSIRIPRGQASLIVINYKLTGVVTSDCIMTSPSGRFDYGAFGESNSMPLNINVKNGAGSVVEALSIPVRINDRALKNKINSFQYSRTFTGCDGDLSSAVNINITTDAASDFNINRINLYFENKRAETTVERNFPKLRAYADIRFVGSGLFQGYWEVDGRMISPVNQHLTYGRSITLLTPDIPSLPTIDPGSHIVRFVITNPQIEMPLPSIVYFVTPKESREMPVSIKLLSPSDKSEVPFSPLQIEWEKPNDSSLFLVSFYYSTDGKPVFSAFVKEGSYMLTNAVLKSYFSSGKEYYWKVKGFDTKVNFSGESLMRSFTFEK